MRNKNQDYEETKRNAQLYKDYTSDKFTILDLQFKYKISSTRIYQLIKSYRKNHDTCGVKDFIDEAQMKERKA